MSEAWFNGEQSYHVTELEEVLVRAKVGAADFEQHPNHYQRLLVSVALFRAAGLHPAQSLDQCMDYARIYQYIMGWEQRAHIDLLETLIEELITVCFDDPKVQACRVALKKPDIFHNVRAAGITFYRRRAEQSGS